MSPSKGIEVITGLIPIRLHLQKLVGRLQLRSLTLPPNHFIQMLMDLFFSLLKHQHSISLKSLTSRQRSNVKGHLVDSNNKLYRIFPFFSPLYPELSPGSRIIDNFSDCFSFNLATRNKNDKIRFRQLDNIVLELSSSPTDTSIKNDIATSISHVHIANHPVIKTLHHIAFVTTTEAKLFAIRYGINQACTKENVFKIIIVTDSIHVAKKIFNTSSHSYQSHVVVILSKLRHLFANNQNSLIEF